jgi:hypothetical protein
MIQPDRVPNDEFLWENERYFDFSKKKEKGEKRKTRIKVLKKIKDSRCALGYCSIIYRRQAAITIVLALVRLRKLEKFGTLSHRSPC